MKSYNTVKCKQIRVHTYIMIYYLIQKKTAESYFELEDEFEDVVEAVGDSTTQWFLRTLQIAPKLLFNSSFLAILVTSGLSGLWFFMSISSETVDLTAVVITSPSLGVFKNYVDKSKGKVRNIGVK